MTAQPPKIIIFDAGALISFTMAGLLDELKKLKKIFNGKFIITQKVKEEVVDNPINVNRFELDALRIKELLDEKVLEVSDAINIDNEQVSFDARKILEIANNTFFYRKKGIGIIQSGEASCLALSKILNEKKIQNVIAIDERTTRMLGEGPENLRKLLQKKLHTLISSKKENYKFFQEFKIIRSAELVYVAYKKKLVNLKNGNVLNALLYAVKFKGCAISDEEIFEIEKMR